MAASAESILSDLVADTAAEDIPANAIEAASRQVLDSIGVALAGAAQPAGSVIAAVLAELGGHPQAHVIGLAGPTSTVQAAWANGSLVHLLDYDDTGFSHPSSCILPPALAVAEARGASGRDLLVAVILGYEVFERLAASGRGDERRVRERGYHPTSVYGCIAGAAAAARLLGLDAGQTTTAMGLAAADASGLTQQFGTWGKGLNAGNACRAGVTSALLAQAGYWGDEQGITGPYGLFSAIHGDGNYDLSGVGEQLGQRWSVVDPGIFLKVYPACGINRRPVDAVLKILAEEKRTPEAIRRIVVHVHPNVFHTLRFRAPTHGFRGKFSLDYTVASAALDGALTIESFTDEMAQRPELREMLAKVELEDTTDLPIERWREVPVDIEWADGSVSSESVLAARGTRENPLSENEIQAKFLDCAERRIDPAQAKNALTALLDLENAGSVRDLMALLTPR